MLSGILRTAGFKQEPSTTFGLIDEDLHQIYRGDVIVLFARAVRFTQPRDQNFVAITQFTQPAGLLIPIQN